MSSARTRSSFSTHPLSISNGGTHRGNNDGTLQSALHNLPPHVSGSVAFPNASEGNLRDSDNTPPINRVDNVRGSSAQASLHSTLPQSGPSQETPQYFVNVCQFVNVVPLSIDARNNQPLVLAPTNNFRPSRELVPPNTILQFHDYSILPHVNEALVTMPAQRGSSTLNPRYVLAPSAFMRQSAGAPSHPPVSDIVMGGRLVRVLRDATANVNPIVANERFAHSPHTAMGVTLPQPQTRVAGQIPNGPFYNAQYPSQQPLLLGSVPHSNPMNAIDVNTTREDGHYSPPLYQYQGNNVTLPTQTIMRVPTQIPQGHPGFIQRGPHHIVPFPLSQLHLTQPHHNAMIITHPPSVITQSSPPRPFPATTVLPDATPLPESPSSSPDKRKSETDKVSKPIRPRKRWTVVTSVKPNRSSNSALPNWITMFKALPATDPRKDGPPCTITIDEDLRESFCTYICLYRGAGPKSGDTCNEEITTNCERNWLRHVGTHAADEEKMIQCGLLKPEDVQALLWVEKHAFLCPVEGCGFTAEEWRVDGIRKAHLKQAHGVKSRKRLRDKKVGRRRGKEMLKHGW